MKFAIPAVIAALALTACSGHRDEEVLANNADEANVAADNNSAAVPAPNTANATNVAKPAPEAASFTQDEQTQDDADATGMTARIDRNAAETGAASNASK